MLKNTAIIIINNNKQKKRYMYIYIFFLFISFCNIHSMLLDYSEILL